MFEKYFCLRKVIRSICREYLLYQGVFKIKRVLFCPEAGKELK